MPKVIQLSDHIANMIAAGEVVEGPLSVVKELTENAIDAKATKIEIHLVDSGTTKIEIVDNGCGMSLEDAVMAFNRHATSKIKTEYDLYRISTLGFRGEALPSIASVSTMELITKENENDGVRILIKSGRVISKETYPANNGTRVIVSNLFYNTPARLKYLKSPQTIMSQISDLVSKLALANKNIRFLLTNNGQKVIQTLGNDDLAGLFASIYGVSIAKIMDTVSDARDGINAKIYYSSPTVTRSRRNDMTVIVNNRFVKSNLINNAIVEAYKNYIPPLRYPICLVELSIDPLLIDVNVHPQKMEIKFSMEDLIFKLVKDTIIKGLRDKTIIPEAEIKEAKMESINMFDYLDEKIEKKQTTQEIKIEPSFNETPITKTVLEEPKATYEVKEKLEEPKIIPSAKRMPYMEYIGQLHGTYLLFQNEEGLYLVDQHAAQERINYEYYFDKFSKPNHDTVPLLIPITLQFPISDCYILEENSKMLEEFGISLERVSENSFFLRSIPAWVKPDSSEDAIEKILYYLLEQKEFNIGKVRDSLAKMVACKASIKANHALSNDEVTTLMKSLEKCLNPFNCPHGRPVFVKLTTYEIEKLFKRVM